MWDWHLNSHCQRPKLIFDFILDSLDYDINDSIEFMYGHLLHNLEAEYELKQILANPSRGF